MTLLPTPDKLKLANLPTPIRPLDRLSEKYGGPRIWLKCDDQTGSVLSGNKIRKLEFCLADALEQGAQMIITCGGLQSNHCRATALAAAQLGLQSHLVLRGKKPPDNDADGNYLLDKLSGAAVSVYPPKIYMESLPGLIAELIEAYSSKGIKAYSIPTGASNAVGIWGYITAAEELLADFKRLSFSPDEIFCATGSGGTQAGLTLGMHLAGAKVPVTGFAVCDDNAYFDQKVRQDVLAWQQRYFPSGAYQDRQLAGIHTDLKVRTIDRYIGAGYAKGYAELYSSISEVASLEGVVLDPVYTGKAFHGLLSEIKLGNLSHCSDVLFLHTGGVFGLYPYRSEFI
ncbi:MAG: D-cysteine desulfhydrase [Alteromonadaceae bacterium]|nr:MAG: D-cysteine desulfhydrase [Alteromonadaceae bacterium]